jgi:hypothetical protein
VLLLGCGRVGFDAASAEPQPAIDVDLTACSISGPITFARASSGTYFDGSGVLRTALAGEPRCAFDPMTQQPTGILVEGGATNYIGIARGDGVATENLPAGWSSQHDVDVTASGVVVDSPVLLGFREVTITTNNTGPGAEFYQVMLDVDVASGGDYTLSWSVRSDAPAGIDACGMFAAFWTPGFGMQIGSDPGRRIPTPTAQWTRPSTTFTAPGGTGQVQAWIICGVLPGMGYTLTIAAPQLEAGRYPTSPILTAGAIDTRAPDLLGMPVSEVLGAAGTLVVDTTLSPDVGAAAPRTAVVVDDARTLAFAPGTAGGGHRIGQAYDATRSALALDGVVRPGAGLTPVTNPTASFGIEPTGANALYGAVARVRAWTEALADESLVTATE